MASNATLPGDVDQAKNGLAHHVQQDDLLVRNLKRQDDAMAVGDADRLEAFQPAAEGGDILGATGMDRSPDRAGLRPTSFAALDVVARIFPPSRRECSGPDKGNHASVFQVGSANQVFGGAALHSASLEVFQRPRGYEPTGLPPALRATPHIVPARTSTAAGCCG